MPNAEPQRARSRSPRRKDTHLVVHSDSLQPTNMSLLAEALMLLASEQRAKAEGSPLPHFAGLHKLAERRGQTSEEGEHA